MKWRKNVPDLGKNNVVKLHQEIKELLLETTRLESRWDTLLHQTFILEDIIASLNSNTSDCVIESTLFPNSRFKFINQLYWLWYCKLKRYIVPAISVLLSIFALLIIVAELAIFIPFMKNLNVFGKLTEIKSYFALNCLLLVVFSYIVFCVYYALFKLKFASFYGLYWNKQTDASSLMFYAMYTFVN